jgi:hypothetical protein
MHKVGVRSPPFRQSRSATCGPFFCGSHMTRPTGFRHRLRSGLVRLWRRTKRAAQRFDTRFRRYRIVVLIFVIRTTFPGLWPLHRYFSHWFQGTGTSPHQFVDRCIYCGSTKQLSNEHIIPINLGGNYVLYRASCESCRLKIHPIETKCLGYFRDIRYRQGIGSRNLETRPTKVAVQFLTNWDGQQEVEAPGKNLNQKWEWKEIPYEEQITSFYLPRFKWPGIMRNSSPESSLNNVPVRFSGHFVQKFGARQLCPAGRDFHQRCGHRPRGLRGFHDQIVVRRKHPRNARRERDLPPIATG